MALKRFYPAINYTARDFNSIKQELVEYAKRYYPDTFRDFNEAGFGSLMLDTVAYTGDILSFYLDYSANESFLDTALEYNNILKIGRQMGYRFGGNPSSFGIATVYIIVPANSSGQGPHEDYIPILQRGTAFSSDGGTRFMLNEDVDFAAPTNEVVVAKTNENSGMPTHYAIKSSGQVISGEIESEVIEVGSFEKFRRIELSADNLTQVLDVVDADGHQYFEVEYLSQDVIFRTVTNRDPATKEKVPSILTPIVVPRRYIVERERDKTFLQFGHGSERDITSDPLIDPATTIMNFYARDYVTEVSFDPANLLGTDKLGVSPASTKLRISYRVNTTETVNISANALSTVADPVFQFGNVNTLNPVWLDDVRTSLEVSNDEPISGDVTAPTSEELKIRIFDTFATQNRAVTQQDYRALSYQMPPEFGAIKRVNVFRDPDSNKRNVNLYVMSENDRGELETPNTAIKQNLKTWLNRSRMINDTVDILEAKIANIGIEFVVVGNLEMNKYAILSEAISTLSQAYSKKLEIGQPFFKTDVYQILNGVVGVVDTIHVEIMLKQGPEYSTSGFNINTATSADGRYINVPENVILEIKFPDSDIRGSVK